MDKQRSCAIRMEGCDDILIKDNKISGYDEAIVAKETRNLKIEGNIIKGNEQEQIIESVMLEINKRFDELKKDKSNKKIESLKETLSNVATSVISETISKLINGN